MVQFYKLLAVDLCHCNGFIYQEGLNVDPLPFDPSGTCQPGGLYFTTLEYLPIWHRTIWPLIADVTLPPDARVYAEPCGTKWKADRLVLSDIRPLSRFLATFDVTAMVLRNAFMLLHVDNPDEGLCMAVVRQDGYALQTVRNQTEAICLAAVQQEGMALMYVKDKTEAVCLAAVKQNGWAVQYVYDQTEAICMAAVQRYGRALQYVRNQTEAICRAAVENDATAVEFVTSAEDFFK
jgi:hypothetical protein